MKKILLMSALALAATTFSVGAKTADELRIYINPGHGGWTPDDRPCTLVGHGAYSRTSTDTLSFFESNTDLEKGFGVLERLIQYGLKFDRTLNQTGAEGQIGAARDLSNNIVMSRVKNGPYLEDNGTANQLKNEGKTVPSNLYIYNRNLSEISAEVDANNFDMFISIHSNAATEGTNTNYPLFLYRGFDDCHEAEGVDATMQATSKEMASKCWKYAFGNEHMVWSYYSLDNMNLRGDISFYGEGYNRTDPNKGLAVGYLGVLRHHTPGFLVEGYFHTYQPARHRAMNWDVCRVEGDAYAHGIADYFGLTKENTGVIYGIVRDEHEKFSDAAYKASITSADIYKPLNGAVVTLKKDGTEVAKYTTDNYYNGAFVFSGVEPGTYTLEFACEEYLPCDPVEVTVVAGETVYPKVTMVNENWTPPTVVYENYPDLLKGNKGILVAGKYLFDRLYQDEAIAQLADKTVRRVIEHNGKLYILALDNAQKPNPTIVVFDPETKAVTEVSTDGTEGTELNISDIQVTADGVLVACAKELCHFSDAQVGLDREDTDPVEVRGDHNVYKWANDETTGLPTGAPEKWFSSQLSGNMYKAYVGETFAYKGTSKDGDIITTTETWYGSGNLFFNCYKIVDGQLAMDGKINSNGEWANKKSLGEGFRLSTSPLDDDHYIVTSPNMGTLSVEFDNPAKKEVGNYETNGIARANAFRMNGHSLVVAPELADASNIGAKLIDITEGVANAKLIDTNLNLEGAEGVSAAAGNVEVKTNDDGEITDAYINVYVVRNGKVSYFSTKGIEQEVNPVAYAYGLKAVEDGQNVNINYSLTADAASAEVVLTSSKKDVPEVKYALDPTKGEHTFVISREDLTEGAEYSWSINVNNNTVATSGVVRTYELPIASRGAVLNITDPQQASFGYTAIAVGRASGISIYNPQGDAVATDMFKADPLFGGKTSNQSNPFRGAEREGKFLFASWGDDACGITYVDPLDLDAGVRSLYAGEKRSDGAYIYNNVNLGGGHSGFAVVGTGEDTKIYAFSEDHDASVDATNRIVRYDIGTAWQITKSPVATHNVNYWLNTNCDLVGYGEGYFISQVRGAGNNTKGCPAFGYYNTKDELVLNSGSDENASWIIGSNSAIAISKDGKTLAIGTPNGQILVADVTWTEGTPTISKRYAFDVPQSAWGTARFDYAGNLYFYSRERQKVFVYALAQENPVINTPALKDNTIMSASGVEEVISDVEDAPVYYYNLQGIRVAADKLVPGIYVKVQGNVSTKVLVK